MSATKPQPKTFLPDQLPADLIDAAKTPVEDTAGPVPELGDALIGTVAGPADVCSRTLHTGLEVPRVKYAADADPDLVAAFELLERITAGGLLYPWSGPVYDQAIGLLDRIRQRVASPRA